MNLRQLKQFVTLAETGNFHKAAELMHMAQPPLSVSIRKLEEEMGGPLFLRTPVGVLLTAAGEAMLIDARQTLAHAHQCQQAVSAALHGEGGLLRMGFVGSATYSLLPRLIPTFLKRYPKVEFDLAESTTASILERLKAHTLDVGLVRYPVLHHGPFRLMTLEEDEFVVAVPAKSEFAKGTSIALVKLAQQPFIMYAQTAVPNLFAVAMLRCQQSGFTPRVAQEAVQVQTIVSLVESGLGVALVPGVAKRYVNRGVKFLTLSDGPKKPTGPGAGASSIGIALATLDDNRSRLVETFSNHAKAVTASGSRQ